MASPVYSILWEQLKALKPSFVSKQPHFNFITVHYFWVVGNSILLSILLYATADGKLAYIDALFFGAGANTQAGLNPVDVNLLNTFQQIAIMIFSMVSNPMAINSFVVFLRLFWFEKRFQDLVRTARTRRGTLTKSKSKARTDLHDAEKGVNGRDIRVMHGGVPQRITNDGFVIDDPKEKVASSSTDGDGVTSSRSRTPPPQTADQGATESKGPGITFAGVVKRSDGMDDTALRIAPRSNEEHIAILQRQRNNENDEVLRIPGPRDVELGERPRKVEGGGYGEPEPLSPGLPRRRRDSDAESPTPPPDRPKVTIQEPDKRNRPSRKEELGDDARAIINVFTPFKIRRPHALNGIKDPTQGGTGRNTFDTIRGALSRDKEQDEAPYLSFHPTLGRNSQFVGDLTDDEREELGGIEYRSLKTLSLILTCYFWGFWALGVIMMVPWIYKTHYYGAVVDNVAQNRGWWGVFTSSSAFTDLGFTLTPDSMNSFNTAVFPLLVMCFFIVIGNTGFPVMLRFVIWIASRVVPRGSGLWEELRFLLDHPRRCFTLLFPAAATWWLFWLLVLLNGLDLIFFIVLDLGSGVVADLSPGLKILDGVFQAFSTRTAGFSCVNLSLLHPGVQTSYMIMMYISIFPIAISVRRTNVYEEKSLGIYQEDGGENEEEAAGSLSYVGAHLRRQLSFDLWYIFIGFFILSISEGTRLQNNEFSMFAVLFEVVSAYGTVGLSLGYTGVNASLSSQFSVIGKLVIIAMQIRGRHRGLPYGLDRAVLLPSESRFRKENELGEHHHHSPGGGPLGTRTSIARRNSGMSIATGTSVQRRGRSRSRDGGGINKVSRVNSNVIVRMLHPGPALPPSAPPIRRVMSDGRPDEDEDDPGFATYRSNSARSDTWGGGR
ncbi:unnamed protein product [Discula destructiva]